MLAQEFGICHPSTGRCSSFSRCCSWRLPGRFFRVTPLEEDAFITFVKDNFPTLLHFIGVTNTLKLIPAARQESEDSKTSWPKLLVFVSGQVRCQCSVSRHIVFYCYAHAAVLAHCVVAVQRVMSRRNFTAASSLGLRLRAFWAHCVIVSSATTNNSMTGVRHVTSEKTAKSGQT